MVWYKKLILTAAVLAVLLVFFFFGLRIRTVHVQGSEIYTEQEIVQSVFTRKLSYNLAVFTLYNKMYGINKLPFVEEIEVSYDNLQTVTLTVYDKTISGCIRYMGQYVYFDKDGIVLQSAEEKRDGVLVVTGLDFVTFTVGEAFDVEDASLFTAIMNLSQLISHYDISVTKIQVGEEKIKLYSGDVVVTLAKKEMYDEEMSALASVLETTAEENLSGTIDMTTFESGDKIILKKKN